MAKSGTTQVDSQTDDDSNTTARVAQAAHDAVDRAARSASEIEQRLRETLEEAKSHTQSRARNAKEGAVELGGEVKKLVHEHPFAALGIAFLGGIVFSSWMRR